MEGRRAVDKGVVGWCAGFGIAGFEFDFRVVGWFGKRADREDSHDHDLLILPTSLRVSRFFLLEFHDVGQDCRVARV